MIQNILYLSFDEVLRIHDSIISQFGGLSGLRDDGTYLRSALARPQQHYHYTKCSIPILASVYIDAIACGHVFNDGNKRTSVKCSEIFLIRNGYFLVCDNFTFEKLVLDRANNQIDFDYLSQIIDSFSIPI